MDELGLDEDDVAGRAQLSGETYNLLGSIDDREFYEVYELSKIKRVVDALELNLLDLLGLKCVFCAKDLEQWRDLAGLPRNEIIRRRREELGLSKEDLLAKLGWTQWFAEHSGPEYEPGWAEGIMREYRAMEDSPDCIERLILDDVMHVAEGGIEVPAQLLLGVTCARCDAAERPS
jgi:hypothetical protein